MLFQVSYIGIFTLIMLYSFSGLFYYILQNMYIFHINIKKNINSNNSFPHIT